MYCWHCNVLFRGSYRNWFALSLIQKSLYPTLLPVCHSNDHVKCLQNLTENFSISNCSMKDDTEWLHFTQAPFYENKVDERSPGVNFLCKQSSKLMALYWYPHLYFPLLNLNCMDIFFMINHSSWVTDMMKWSNTTILLVKIPPSYRSWQSSWQRIWGWKQLLFMCAAHTKWLVFDMPQTPYPVFAVIIMINSIVLICSITGTCLFPSIILSWKEKIIRSSPAGTHRNAWHAS